MALMSSSSNWVTTLQNLNSDMTTFQPTELLGDYDSLDLANTFVVDPPLDLSYEEENYNYSTDHLLPNLFSPPLISLSPEIFLHEDFDPYTSLKRHKYCYDNLHCSDFIPAGSFDGYVPNSSEFSPELLIDPSPLPPPPQCFHHHVPQVVFEYCSTNITNVESMKSSDESRCISAQSIAARQRRRKITGKTTELGKLIPGGNKMNTAEMLQAAFNYVKFLQAQVGILDSMPSFQENKNAEIQAQLLASPTIQEKLYLGEKCLVPKQFVQVLTKRHDLQSNPSISNHLDRLIQSEL